MMGCSMVAEFFQEGDNLLFFAVVETGGRGFQCVFVIGKRFLDQGMTGSSQFHMNPPPVTGMVLAPDPAFLFQAVDGGGNRSTGQKNFFPDRIYRKRAFMQQDFEHGKIGKTKSQRNDMSPDVFFHCPGGFVKNQPNPGSLYFHSHFISVSGAEKRSSLHPGRPHFGHPVLMTEKEPWFAEPAFQCGVRPV